MLNWRRGKHYRVDDLRTKSKTTNAIGRARRKETCSLNLFCRRPRSSRYVFEQITVLAPKLSRRLTKSELRDLECDPEIFYVHNDPMFFETLNFVYRRKFCGFWRRWFSLKTLRSFKLVRVCLPAKHSKLEIDRYTPDYRDQHEIWDEDPRYLEDALFYYHNPSKVGTHHWWIRSIFELRQRKYRHALQFVEGWSGWRVAIAGSIPGVVSTFVAVVWATNGGELSVVFTVSAFILAAFALLVAVLGLVSEAEN